MWLSHLNKSLAYRQQTCLESSLAIEELSTVQLLSLEPVGWVVHHVKSNCFLPTLTSFLRSDCFVSSLLFLTTCYFRAQGLRPYKDQILPNKFKKLWKYSLSSPCKFDICSNFKRKNILHRKRKKIHFTLSRKNIRNNE